MQVWYQHVAPTEHLQTKPTDPLLVSNEECEFETVVNKQHQGNIEFLTDDATGSISPWESEKHENLSFGNDTQASYEPRSFHQQGSVAIQKSTQLRRPNMNLCDYHILSTESPD